jgi:drug/metabolite transporter (DMT)-like permease
LNGWTVLGCALILGGVYLVNVYRPRISGLALAVVREETVENEA